MSISKSFLQAYVQHIKIEAIIKSLSPVAYYPMQEDIGVSECKNLSTENRRSMSGTITGATTGQDGYLGKCYSFDGNDYISCTNNSLLNITSGKLTLLGIVNRANSTSYRVLIDKGWETYALWIHGGKIYFQCHDGTAYRTGSESTNAMNYNQAYLIAVTLDTSLESNNLKYYLNGSLNGQQDFTYVPKSDSGQQLRISGKPDHGYTLVNGDKCQDIAVFNYALSSEEITEIATIAGFI